MHARSVCYAILCCAFLLSPGASALDQPMLGEKAPAFDLETTTGDRLSSDGLRGNFLVIHFGASW